MPEDEIEHEEVTKEEFDEAVKAVLLHTLMKKEPLEKRMPTREELEKKWRLLKRKPTKNL